VAFQTDADPSGPPISKILRWFRKPAKLMGTTVQKLLISIGVGPKRAIDVEFAGLKEIDIHRLLQIADRLDVSLEWLTGRTGRRDIAH
jgi:hypothetical protein